MDFENMMLMRQASSTKITPRGLIRNRSSIDICKTPTRIEAERKHFPQRDTSPIDHTQKNS